MKDPQAPPQGPQLYLLSEHAYEDLKEIRDTLQMMAHVTCSDDGSRQSIATLRIPQMTLHLFFDQLTAQLSDALEQLNDENGIGGKGRRWQ